MADEIYVAIVQKVFPEGKHGPYAKARSEEVAGSITFSLDISVWKEDRTPQEGDKVVLSKVRGKRAGWRAESGRFFKPSDERQQTGVER
ncbi:MAG: hypothetical protein V4690_00260 [Patescibacteria group bacterium]